jgi:hypothetical protein
MSQTYDVIDYYFPFLILFEHCVMMSMLCNCYVRGLLILARTWFAFGLPSKTGCDTEVCNPCHTPRKSSNDLQQKGACT